MRYFIKGLYILLIKNLPLWIKMKTINTNSNTLLLIIIVHNHKNLLINPLLFIKIHKQFFDDQNNLLILNVFLIIKHSNLLWVYFYIIYHYMVKLLLDCIIFVIQIIRIFRNIMIEDLLKIIKKLYKIKDKNFYKVLHVYRKYFIIRNNCTIKLLYFVRQVQSLKY